LAVAMPHPPVDHLIDRRATHSPACRWWSASHDDKYRMREVQYENIGTSRDPYLSDQELHQRIQNQESDLEDRVRASCALYGGLEIMTSTQERRDWNAIIANDKGSSLPAEMDPQFATTAGVTRRDNLAFREQLLAKLAECEEDAQSRAMNNGKSEEAPATTGLRSPSQSRIQLHLLDRDLVEEHDKVRLALEEETTLRMELEHESLTAQITIDAITSEAEAAYEAVRQAEAVAAAAQARVQAAKKGRDDMRSRYEAAIIEAEINGEAATTRLEEVYQEREEELKRLDAARAGTDGSNNNADRMQLEREAQMRADLHMQARLARDVAWGAPGEFGALK